MDLPELVGRTGEDAAFRTLEFFTARTPNPHTRGLYAQAVRDFCVYGPPLPRPCVASGPDKDALVAGALAHGAPLGASLRSTPRWQSRRWPPSSRR